MIRVFRHVGGGNTVRLMAALAVSALLAGCSSSSDRFEPFYGTEANPNPGYAVSSKNSGRIDRSYAAANPSGNNLNYSNAVETSPLEPAKSREDFAAKRSTYAPAPSSYVPERPAYTPERPDYNPKRTVYAPEAPVHTANTSARSGTVMVRPGDTLYSLSRTHNVGVRQLIETNDIEPPYSIKVGESLRLPGGGSPARVTPAAAGHHIVRPGETLYSISRGNGLRPSEVAQANSISAPYIVKIGQRLQIPGGGSSAFVRTASVKSGTDSRKAPVKAVARVVPPTVSSKPAKIPVRTASIGNQATKPQPKKKAYQGALPRPSPRAAKKFRWPVKGKVISRFGSKPNGVRNDGINIAVPSGASVKAAENGVVAYSGNELKGYGNLVLIKHADNWVTAYAHNSRLLVSRGDRVTRGQVVAKAGRTGSVNSPQLHFEVRRGSQAVDPMSALDKSQFAGR